MHEGIYCDVGAKRYTKILAAPRVVNRSPPQVCGLSDLGISCALMWSYCAGRGLGDEIIPIPKEVTR